MSKIRVYELAKRMGVPPNQLADKLRDLGIEIKSNLAAVDESVIQRLGGSAPIRPEPPGAETSAPHPQPAEETRRTPTVLKAKSPVSASGEIPSGPAPTPPPPALPKPPGLLSAKPRAAFSTELPKPPGLLSAKPRAATTPVVPGELPRPVVAGKARVLLAKPRVPRPPVEEAADAAPAEVPAPQRTPEAVPEKPRRPVPAVQDAAEAPEKDLVPVLPPAPEPPPEQEPEAPPAASTPEPIAAQEAPEAPEPPPREAARPETPPPPPKVETIPPPRPSHLPTHRPSAIITRRPGAVITHRPDAVPGQRPPETQPTHRLPPQGTHSPRPGAPPSQRSTPTHPGRPSPTSPTGRPGAPSAPAGRTGTAPSRPSSPSAPTQPPRPPSRLQPPADIRRKTKRERRMGKVQAREDRRAKLQDELETAKANAATGEAVFIREGISVKELADKIAVKVKDVIAKLMMRGILATINQPLDAEVAIQLCSQFGFSAEIISYEDEMVLTQPESSEGEKTPRAPVVTVMGHVDHGKSSLLEAIHDVDITSKESGGITQHIGAYKVKKGDHEYVFLDTPGHEAFTLMRARGAQVTDVVILVVAADDGVMPQTVEAINHCKAAGVPMVVAINKMDKPGANPDRVKQDLMAHGVVAEEFGGEVVAVKVSAKARQGIDELLEMVFIVSDMLQLKASIDQPASGTILESRLDRARGPVASVLIQDGTLKVGDLFLCGSTYGHVRGLFDDRGHRLESAGPSTPVEVLGFSEVPAVGALYQVMDDEAKARQVAAFRKEQEKAKSLRTTKVRLENVFGAIQQGELKELALIVKADVHGSLEALNGQIQNLPQDQIRTRVVHQGVGAISESDILLASASNALVIGFNVRADKKATDLSKSEAVEILTFTVIYDLVDRLKQALSGMLKPIEREAILGHAEVKEVYRIGKVGTVAGCIVTDGKILRVAHARVLRDNIVIHTGKFSSLRRFKDDVSEVREGSECGIGVENYQDIKPADVLEAFEIQMEERKL